MDEWRRRIDFLWAERLIRSELVASHPAKRSVFAIQQQHPLPIGLHRAAACDFARLADAGDRTWLSVHIAHGEQAQALQTAVNPHEATDKVAGRMRQQLDRRSVLRQMS